eukprot:gene18156-21630_t
MGDRRTWAADADNLVACFIVVVPQVAVASEVHFDWDDTGVASTFQAALVSNISEIFVVNAGSNGTSSFWTQVGIPETLSASTAQIAASPPPPSPPPDLPSPPPPPAGVVRVDSTVLFGFEDSASTPSSLVLADFIPQYTVSVAAAAGVPAESVTITSFYPAGSPTDSTPKDAGAETYYIYADDETDAALLDAVAAGDLAASTLVITAQVEFPWTSTQEAEQFEQLLVNNTRSVFQQSADGGDDPYWDQFSTVELDDGTEFATEFNAAIIASVATSAGVPLEDVGASAMVAAAGAPGTWCEIDSISSGVVRIASVTHFSWDAYAAALLFREHLDQSTRSIFTGDYWEQFGVGYALEISDTERVDAADIPPPPPAPPPGGVYLLQSTLRFADVEVTEMLPGSALRVEFEANFIAAMGAAAGVPTSDVDVVSISAGSVVVASTVTFLWTQEAEAQAFELTLATSPSDVFPAAGERGGWAEYGEVKTISVSMISKIAGTSFDLTVQLDLPGVVHYLVLPADSPDAAQLVAYSLLGRTAMHGVQLQTGSGSAEWWDAFAQSVAEACGSARAADVGMVSSNSSETDPTTTIVRYEVRVSRNTADAARSALLEESADGSLLQRLQEHGLGEVIRLETSDVETSEEVQAGAVAAHAGGEGAVKGAVECPDNERSEVVNIEDIASETVHSVFVVAVRHIWQTVVQEAATVMLEVTTLDVTAPSWWSSTSAADDGTEVPRVEAATATSLVVAVALNEPGRVYYAVKEPPSPEHIIAGEAPTSVATGAVEVPKVGTEVMIEVDGLTSETTYTVHLVAEDNRTPPNWQEEPTRLRASTLDITPPQLEVLGTVNIQ